MEHQNSEKIKSEDELKKFLENKLQSEPLHSKLKNITLIEYYFATNNWDCYLPKLPNGYHYIHGMNADSAFFRFASKGNTVYEFKDIVDKDGKKVEKSSKVEVANYWNDKDCNKLLNFLTFYNAYTDGEKMDIEDLNLDSKLPIKQKCYSLSKQRPINIILYGPPGTGKTYTATKKAVEIIEANVKATTEKKSFNDYIDNKQIVFTTFHQSMCYEDFVEGIKPETKNGSIEYNIQPGIFKQMCKKAEEDKDNRYVLIIDEINRGNVAQIFGELITLIEENKRIGNEEELKVTLPYSKEQFGVPNNLYIIGTMNTADRSVEALDSALRRRFVFEEMMPNYEMLKEINIENVNLGTLLQTINDRITCLKGREFQIGHSYFMECHNIDDLKEVFNNNIIPLLQEYFYNDYSLIKSVLGKDFVKEESLTLNGKTYNVYNRQIPDNFEEAIKNI